MSIPVANANDKRLTQQLARDLSDRVHITDTETGLNADFFVEQISHATSGTGRVLTTTFGCEKADATRPANVFVFDDATNGKFNTGKFGTLTAPRPRQAWIPRASAHTRHQRLGAAEGGHCLVVGVSPPPRSSVSCTVVEAVLGLPVSPGRCLAIARSDSPSAGITSR